MTMNTTHRFYAVLLSIGFATLAACSSSNTPTEVTVDFSINGVKGTISGQNVTIDLTTKESCSNLSSLIIGVQANGASISPDPTVARDYSSPVAFTITAPDGTKVVYTVTVKGNTCAPPPPVSPKECKADAIGSTGYSLVFKGCTADNMAEYYDKTECVRDNATGLIWEGKTTSGLRASGDKYNNLDSTVLLQIAAKSFFVPGQGVINAPARPPTQAEIDSPLNSVWYKNSVNATTLCGASNWRMPAKDELLSIRVSGTTTLIDFEWFPNTEWYGSYATSTQFEDQQSYAWTVQFYNLDASSTSSTTRESSGVHPTLGPIYSPQNSIRLVRAP